MKEAAWIRFKGDRARHLVAKQDTGYISMCGKTFHSQDMVLEMRTNAWVLHCQQCLQRRDLITTKD